MINDWFSPIPYDYSETRVTLDFGLTATTRYYNELIVPKIGSVRTLRAFSYALAGIRLHREFGKTESSTIVAHGIESLANKIYWMDNKDSNDVSVLGINGFKQSPNEWSFKELIKFYVKSNTMRQSTVSALKNFQLVNGGTFNSFTLTKQGEVIADLFLSSNHNLTSVLLNWLNGKRIDDVSKLRNISTDSISKAEVSQLKSFLRHKDTDGNVRRKNLWEVYENGKEYDSLGDAKHIQDIKLVESFEEFKTELINFYLAITNNSNLGEKTTNIKIDNSKLLQSIGQYEERLKRTQSFSQPEVVNLVSIIKSNQGTSLIEALVKIENQLIIIDDNNRIQKGILFRKDRISSLQRESQVGKLSRLVQLQKLVTESL